MAQTSWFPYDSGRPCPHCTKRPVVRVDPLGNLYRCERCRCLWLLWEGRLWHPGVTRAEARRLLADELALAEAEAATARCTTEGG